MKPLFFALFLFIHSIELYSQKAPITFETNGFGATWIWNVFENGLNPPLEFVTNPDTSGINKSATVAKFTALKNGEPYAGTESIHGPTALGPFILDNNTSKIKISVLKSVISDVGIKFASPTGWSQGEKKISNTKINQWEELVFDFSDFVNPPSSQGQLDQIIIFPDFKGGRTQDNIIYFDNISFLSKDTTSNSLPLVAAPTPTRNPSSVISMFSNAYTNVPVDTWRTDWSSGLLADIKIQDNDTKKYTTLNFVGIETVTKQIDITGMSHFHVDMWTTNMTTFRVKLVDFGANGIFAGGDDTEHEVVFENPGLSQWNSLDIPLTQFTNLAGKKNIAQLIFSGLPVGSSTVYLDNVYFYNAASSVFNIENKYNVKVFPNPSKNGTNLNTNLEFNSFELYNIQGQLLEGGNQEYFTNLSLKHGIYFVKFELSDNTNSTVKIVVE